MPYERVFHLAYVGACIFELPNIIITIVYARLLYFIRHQSPQIAQSQQGRRAQRDLVIARRLFFLINALVLPTLPNVIFTLMTAAHPSITGSYYMYRVQFMGPAISFTLASVLLIFLTPKIKELLPYLRKAEHRRVTPVLLTVQNQVSTGIQTITLRA